MYIHVLVKHPFCDKLKNDKACELSSSIPYIH